MPINLSPLVLFAAKMLGRYSCRWFGHVFGTKREDGLEWVCCEVPGCTLQFKVYGLFKAPTLVGYEDI